MGQIAEDMLDGSMCSLCGCYFQGRDKDGETFIYVHETPTVCWDCWEIDCGYPRAKVDTY